MTHVDVSGLTGVGLRTAHYDTFLGDAPPKSVSWVEVITENFLPWKRGLEVRSVKNLEKIRRNYSVSLHGVSLNLGSADPIDSEYLLHLNALVKRFEPVRVSDHLCWTGLERRNSHDLLPIPYTREAIDLVVEKVNRVQEALGCRLTVENVSAYVEWRDSEMGEAEFITEIQRRTGCGLLLDFNNVAVTARNLGRSADHFLSRFPHEAVTQIHLAGPSEREDGTLIDTHDSEVRPEVWALLGSWARKHGANVPVMIERDGNIPEWSELETEVLKIPRVLSGEVS